MSSGTALGPVSRMPTPSAMPPTRVAGHSSRGRSRAASATHTAAPITASPPECSTALVKNTPFKAAAKAASVQTMPEAPKERASSQPAMPSSSRQAAG